MERLGLLLGDYIVNNTPAHYLFKERKSKAISNSSSLQPKLQVLMEQTLPSHSLKITSCNFKEVFTCCLVYLRKEKNIISMVFALLLRRGFQSQCHAPQCIDSPYGACAFVAPDLYALHLQTSREPPHSSCLGH